ncbi:lytic transglycosylase domain-containing protein [Actinocrispum wychmicini]|nr:lytic murein transglycosylase [Actinocrispum wychmicini]
MRFLRRRRGLVAVVVAVLLVPVAAAADTAGWVNAADAKPLVPVANGLGRGFFGMDLDDLGATGQLPQVDQLSDQLLRLAGDPGALASSGDPISVPSGPLGIPGPAKTAYDKAAALLATQQPNCHMPWYLLASIGRIESNHGNGGQVDAKGNALTPIYGPTLNGLGFAAVPDTDHGQWDADTQWDRAIGPMQFIPSTWEQYASDGNGDGVKNPQNFYDAALAAGKFLCSGGLDMANDQQRGIAVFRYNHSESYVRTVLIWANAYANNMTVIPPDTGVTNVANTTNNTPSNNPGTQQPPPQQPPTSTPTSTSSSSTTSSSSKVTVTIPATTSSSSSSSSSSTPPSSSSSSSSSSTPPTCSSSSAPPDSSAQQSAQPTSTSQASAAEHAAAAAADDPCKPAAGSK